MSDAPTPQHGRQPVGPVAAAVIVVLLCLIGGVYFFMHQIAFERQQAALESAGE